jgi:hypothetical protein
MEPYSKPQSVGYEIKVNSYNFIFGLFNNMVSFSNYAAARE